MLQFGLHVEQTDAILVHCGWESAGKALADGGTGMWEWRPQRSKILRFDAKIT